MLVVPVSEQTNDCILSDVDQDEVEVVSTPKKNEYPSCISSDLCQGVVDMVAPVSIATKIESPVGISMDIDQDVVNTVTVSMPKKNNQRSCISSEAPQDIDRMVAPVPEPTINETFTSFPSDVDSDVIEMVSVSMPKKNEHLSCMSSDVIDVAAHVSAQKKNEGPSYILLDAGQGVIEMISVSTPKRNEHPSCISLDVPQDVVGIVGPVSKPTNNEDLGCISSDVDHNVIEVVSVFTEKTNEQLPSIPSDKVFNFRVIF